MRTTVGTNDSTLRQSIPVLARARRGAWVAMLVVSAMLAGATEARAQTTKPAKNDGSQAQEKKDDGRFLKMHEANLKRAEEGPVGLLFMGDSITAGWQTRAKDLFAQTYGKYQPANFGIGGDKTENILWRIDHGELDKIKPKVMVLMIGTNNSGTNTAPQISAAIKKIIDQTHAKLPETKILLLAVFPRGPHTVKKPDGTETKDDGVKRNEVIKEVNATISKLDDGKMVRYLDIGEKFKVDGKIPDSIMPDQLHPSPEGYKIWVSAMQPLLEEMMKE